MGDGNKERAPVQGDGLYYLKDARNIGSYPPGTIEWWEHEKAWVNYSLKYGVDQSAEVIASRGGFSYKELINLLGHDPTTWEKKDSIS